MIKETANGCDPPCDKRRVFHDRDANSSVEAVTDEIGLYVREVEIDRDIGIEATTPTSG